MQKCIFYTCVYNAEKTLSRAVDSIYAQNYENWDYYILDNGSTDNTPKIIAEYANNDQRIIPLRNDKNMVWKKENTVDHFGVKYNDDDFFCVLDSDDEYKPNFLENMLEFTLSNALDVASCGHDFIDTSINALVQERVLSSSLILEGNGFSDYFTQYHQFMRSWWCKLFSFSTIRKADFRRRPYVVYGGDTLFAQEMFRNSKRVGILAESLHKYYLSPTTTSYKWNPKRIEADRILDETVRMFLMDKCGAITSTNDEFLLKVYFNAIKDTIVVLINSNIELNKALENLQDIITCEQTERIISWGGYKKEKERLFGEVVNWITTQNGSMLGANEKITLDIFDAMGV